MHVVWRGDDPYPEQFDKDAELLRLCMCCYTILLRHVGGRCLYSPHRACLVRTTHVYWEDNVIHWGLRSSILQMSYSVSSLKLAIERYKADEHPLACPR